MLQWDKHLQYKYRIWVEISRTQVKLEMIASIYNPRVPIMEQEVETAPGQLA